MTDVTKESNQNQTFEKILTMALKTPGVKIHRDKFLHKELIKYYPDTIVQQAIEYNPAKAGLSKERINTISRQIINYETAKATSISVAASLPSSGVAAAAVGAAAADITSFFAFILRVVQQLSYLYGFEEFELSENGMDAETKNYIMIFLGVMFGVQGAAKTLAKLADTMAKHVAKTLARKALTKGTIYPIVKQIATKVGIRMTKQIFADTVASGIPIAGAILSGTLTYAMFKPCCNKLRKNLMSYDLCNPDYYNIE